MNIKNIKVTCSKTGEIWSTHSGHWQLVTNPVAQAKMRELVKTWRSKRYTEQEKEIVFENCMRIVHQCDSTGTNDVELTEELLTDTKSVMQKLIDFFSEFSFEPNFRFVNTLCKYAQRNTADARSYISNYFKLTDHQFASSIVEKMRSSEFSELINAISALVCTKTVNNRFKVYYGSQGTGKTTMAMKETNNLCMVCHSAMLPSDLMEDFKFENGQPSFKPSALQIAMTSGTKIVLDEINLLPFESLRFLQSILDGKTEFTYKGQTVRIADGFQIIGTMNLTVNGNTFCLPEPLVDRACELREYTLTADALVGALI